MKSVVIGVLFIFSICLTTTFSAPNEENTNSGAIKISGDEWVNLDKDSAWTFEKNDVHRATNRRISKLMYTKTVDSSFRLEYNLEVLKTGGSDGKAVKVLAANNKYLFFTIGDDYPMGIRGIKEGAKKSSYLAKSKDIKIEAGKRYHVVIEVEPDRASLQVDGEKISAEYELASPYKFHFTVQRTGAIFSNITLKKSRKGNTSAGKDNVTDDE